MKRKKLKEWLDKLTPLYGDREARNMWRWHQEANRPADHFDYDLMRLAEYYPIQYLTGYAWFYGEKFYVNEHTLIPRPETEELVYKVLEDHLTNHKLRVIDLGTGTGCIPITIKMHRPEWDVSGLEWYTDTLDVARKNDQLHQAGIHWIHGNILDIPSYINQSYDIVICNPPYITMSEKPGLDQNVVGYEPHKALFTEDEQGLEYYKAIARFGQFDISKGTVFYLEIHEDNSKDTIELFSDSEIFTSPEIIQDMQGKDRILKVISK